MAITFSRTIAVSEKTGRNDPCPCGSGKKFKKCCLGKDQGYSSEERGGLIREAVAYLTDQEFFAKPLEKELDNLFADSDDLHEESEHNPMTEAFIFEYMYQGKTALEYFIRHANLSPEKKAIYTSWRDQTVFSFFEVNFVKLGTFIEATDLVTNKRYTVYERMATYGLEEGMTLVSRIVPFKNAWMFAGGFIKPFPKDALHAVKRSISQAGKELKKGQIMFLREMHKHNKPDHIDEVTEIKPSEEELDTYDKAIHLMVMKHDFLKALLLFAKIAKTVSLLPEPFRWYGNVGACLGYLGEFDLAKKYFEKSLQIKPTYKFGIDNLKNIQSDVTKHEAIFGQQRLFFLALDNPFHTNFPGLQDNEMLRDANKFLAYIKNKKIKVTEKNRNMQLKYLLMLNKELTNPDPEKVIITELHQVKNVDYFYEKEWQFPKINFLHTVFYFGKLVKTEGDTVLLTRKGQSFLSERDGNKQFEIVFRIWFGIVEWRQFGREGWIHEKTITAEKILQHSSWNILEKFLINKKRPIHPKSLFTDIAETKSDKDFEFWSTMFLTAMILNYLVWAGVLIKNETKGGNLMEAYAKTTFQLTDFGLYFLETLQKRMRGIVPEIIRTMT